MSEEEKLKNFSKQKTVPLENFKSLFYNLNLRDRCIASILYFYSMPLSCALLLQKKTDIWKNLPEFCKTHFEKYTTDTPEEMYFLFSNRRGRAVERTHVVNAFARASKDTLYKITPSDLTETKKVVWE